MIENNTELLNSTSLIDKPISLPPKDPSIFDVIEDLFPNDQDDKSKVVKIANTKYLIVKNFDEKRIYDYFFMILNYKNQKWIPQKQFIQFVNHNFGMDLKLKDENE